MTLYWCDRMSASISREACERNRRDPHFDRRCAGCDGLGEAVTITVEGEMGKAKKGKCDTCGRENVTFAMLGECHTCYRRRKYPEKYSDEYKSTIVDDESTIVDDEAPTVKDLERDDDMYGQYNFCDPDDPGDVISDATVSINPLAMLLRPRRGRLLVELSEELSGMWLDRGLTMDNVSELCWLALNGYLRRVA